MTQSGVGDADEPERTADEPERAADGDGASRWGPSVTARHVIGLPKTCSIIGGGFLMASGLFPWFTAGAIATDVLQGRALVAAIVGSVVLVTGLLAARAVDVWQVVCAVSFLVGGVLLVSAAFGPPVELTASLGVALGAVGTCLVGLGLFASRWRRDSSDPEAVAVAPEAAPVRSRARTVGRVLAIAGAVIVVALIVVPSGSPSLETAGTPTESYDEAVARFDAVVAAEDGINILDRCRSRLLDHGRSTDVAVVLFHGLTNCPEQFLELGTELFDDGANVVILRAPQHGLADSSGTEIGGVGNISSLTAHDLRDYADQSVDIATGLGDEVRVLGLSMGGVVSTWTAQERSDVDRVVAVAPALTIPFVPASLTHVFRNVFDKLPNVSLPATGNTIDHAYAGGSTKGLTATFTMASFVADAAYGRAPAADDVIVVLNPDDEQVDPDHLSKFANAWATHGGPVTLHRFPAVGLPHDVIDLDQPEANADLVYPILIDLLEGRSP